MKTGVRGCHPIYCALLPTVAISFVMVSPAHALDRRPMRRSPTAIDRIVADLRKAKRFDRATIERITHSGLRPTSATSSFRTYEAKGVKVGSLTVDFELRESKEGSDATAGPLFVIRLIRGCPRKSDVEARYSPWKLTDVPRGESWDEEAYWSRLESWGKLSFGFAESAPDCLRTVAFNVRNRQGEVR